MNVKRYYGQQMPAIMEQVRQELGPDAVILSNRSFRKGGIMGLFSPKTIEVMVAYEEKPTPSSASVARNDAINKLTDQVDALSRAMTSTGRPTDKRNTAPPVVSPVAVSAYSQAASHADNIPEKPKVERRNAQQASAQRPALPPKPEPKPFIPIKKEEIPEVYDMRGTTQEPLSALEPPEPQQRRNTMPTLEQQILESTAPRRSPAPPPQTATAPPVAPTPQAIPVEDNARLNLLDKRIDALQDLLNGFATQLRTIGVVAYSPQVEALRQRLINNEVDADLARELAERVSSDQAADKDEALAAAICDILGNEPQPIKVTPGRRSIVVMAGSTGVGKTTTLVKLAAHYVVRENLKVGLINTDTFRIAAQEQLKTYADILEIPLGLAYSADEVETELSRQADRDIIFIDTAGKRSSDEKHKQEIKRLLEKSMATDVMLVLSATTAPKSIRDIIENYSFINDYRLLITKIDEAKTIGMALNACYYSSKPLSYMTNGQNVPDDLEIADARSIAARVME